MLIALWPSLSSILYTPVSSLFPILDAALADTTARSGDWLACKPGCHQCCVGVFAISQMDAQNLREALALAEPHVAERIRTRVAASRERLTPDFPGDATTGQLFTEPHHEEAFEEFANDEPCPVLDPATGTCDLYAARPLPCRTFGPPMPNDEGGLAVCELCFVDAPVDEVARCAVDATFLELEVDQTAPTLIAFALR